MALLIAAGEASPASRIEFRDPIAAFGDQAVERLSRPEWIGDPTVRGIRDPDDQQGWETRRADGSSGNFAAPSSSSPTRPFVVTSSSNSLRFGASLGVKKANTKHSKVVTAPISVDGPLRVGACYRRRDLHLGGLGGNWQKGISYPADGTHCLLFSDPSKASDYGYRDEPFGADGYRYFGEWGRAGRHDDVWRKPADRRSITGALSVHRRFVWQGLPRAL